MIYAIDIDGTICTNTGGKYMEAIPYKRRIEIVNQLVFAGHYVKLYTARGTTTGKDWEKLTRAQLEEWGVFYHELIFGKPEFDVLIDDKVINSEQFFNNLWHSK